MSSDQALASCVESLLRQGGPASLSSVNGVVRQLEANLGIDLSHKTSFIHDQIDNLLGPRFHQLPAASVSENHHFSQIPSAVSPSANLPHHQKDHPPPLTAQMSQETVAAANTAHQKHINHHQYLPVAIALPAPAHPGALSPATASKGSVPAAAKRRGGPGGLSKVCGVSSELQAIVGEPTMARTEIVKQLWAYIRKNNLQDPSNKRKIICNEELRLLFETDSTDMFKMNKLLSKHIIPLEITKEPESDPKRLKKIDKEECAPLEAQASQYTVVISDALAEFFGMEEREILQSDALTRVWDYIKAEHLEDPMKNMILCDAKLQELFGCESLSSSGVSEMLAQHLFRQS